VPLDHIALDLGRVTGGKILRYAKPFPYGGKVNGLIDPDGEAGGLEMPYPARTTSAIRILVNEYAGTLAEGGSRRHGQCRCSQSKDASPRQAARMTDRWTIHGLDPPFCVAML
jgi:hypothetical protein